MCIKIQRPLPAVQNTFFLLPFKGKQKTGAVINNVEIELVVIRCKCMTLIVFPPTVICDMYFFTTNENKDN